MANNSTADTEPVKINSYIILDLETTGLPSLQLVTKITELSILCLSRSNLLKSYETYNEDKHLPRVINKLNLCIYPKKFITTRASEISGLSNELLQHCRPFDSDTFDIIRNVISVMEPPICILAHNGYKFDFPILRSEINHIGKSLADDLYCADTLLAFKELLPKDAVERVAMENFDFNVILEIDQTIEITDEENIPVENVPENCKIDWGSASLDGELRLAAEEAESKYLKEIETINLDAFRMINETTPKSRKSRFVHVKKKVLNDKKSIVSKQLFSDNVKLSTTPKSYQLKDIYNFLTGKELIDAHKADCDTHALLECVVAIGPPILQWIDNNFKPFNSIKKCW